MSSRDLLNRPPQDPPERRISWKQHFENRRKVLRTAKRKHPMKEEPKYTQPFWAKWMWWPTVLLAACFASFSYTVFAWKNRPWTDFLWLIGAAVFLTIVRYFQRKGIEKRVNNLPTNPNNHMNDVWYEGSRFPVMKPDGAPITEFRKWYMARYQRSESQYLVDTINLADDLRLRNEHRAYLADKRFDKFLRP